MLTLGPLDETAIAPMRAAILAISSKDVPVEVLQRRVAASGTWGDHGIEFGVAEAGRPLGVVQASHCPIRGMPGSYEVGILVFEPDQRARGVGTEALALLLDVLFGERQAIRAWFTTDHDNVAMRRLGERLGFRLEGELRGNRASGDQLVDAVLYGITRDDPRPWVSRSAPVEEPSLDSA